MRRADRLIDLVARLKAKPLVRAEDLAAAMETSVRTIYRDIATLQAMGLPRDAYESGPYGGYGEHFIGEGRGALYPSDVLEVMGEPLPWIGA